MRCQRAGAHIYCVLFGRSPPRVTWVNLGAIVVQGDEWEELRDAMPGVLFEVIGEDETSES